METLGETLSGTLQITPGLVPKHKEKYKKNNFK
jgi:hypothetical protein